MNGRSGTSRDSSIPRNSSFSDPTWLTTSLANSITTEGWLELFLKPSEKATFQKWHENVNDKSLTHKATRGLFEIVASNVPDNVAPNVVTAAGFLLLGQAWSITNLYGEQFVCICVSSAFVFGLFYSGLRALTITLRCVLRRPRRCISNQLHLVRCS